ncbi:MAG: helix-turn-helix transcriptional regulator [Rhizobiaceae bacterium]|nr:helix-turn-helix transcriptional regulator [Rhizobiaceae bacterium]
MSASPISVLRRFLQSDPDLAAIGTQSGLARFVGKSESLLRNVEKGRQAMKPSLARLLSEKFQISEEWLLKNEVPSSPIPSKSGSPLEVRRLKEYLADGLNIEAAPWSGGEISLDPAYRAIARSVGELVEKEILIYLQGDDASNPDPVKFLIDWVRERSSKR